MSTTNTKAERLYDKRVREADTPGTRMFAEFVRAVIKGDRREPTFEQVSNFILQMERSRPGTLRLLKEVAAERDEARAKLAAVTAQRDLCREWIAGVDEYRRTCFEVGDTTAAQVAANMWVAMDGRAALRACDEKRSAEGASIAAEGGAK